MGVPKITELNLIDFYLLVIFAVIIAEYNVRTIDRWFNQQRQECICIEEQVANL